MGHSTEQVMNESDIKRCFVTAEIVHYEDEYQVPEKIRKSFS